LKKGFLTVAYPQNATEQAAVPVGLVKVKSNRNQPQERYHRSEVEELEVKHNSLLLAVMP